MRDLVVGCIGIVMGALCVVLMAVLGLAYFNTNRPSEETAQQSARPDITITVSSAFVKAQMQDAIKQSKMANQASVALLPPNRFRIASAVPISFVGQNLLVNATATLSVRVINGRATVAMDQVDVGGVDMPGELVSPFLERMRSQSEDQLNRLISRSLQGTNLRLTGIRVASDSVMLDLNAS